MPASDFTNPVSFTVDETKDDQKENKFRMQNLTIYGSDTVGSVMASFDCIKVTANSKTESINDKLRTSRS